MTLRRFIGVAVVCVFWSGMSEAQQPSIPFQQIARDAQAQAHASYPNAIAFNRESSSSSYMASPAISPSPRPTPIARKIIDRPFVLLNALHLGMAALDVALTQHCIAESRCVEGNPIMPKAAAGQIGIDLALVSYGSYVSYRMKKHGGRLWWATPMIGTAAHGVGVLTGFAHN